jgi:PAS domain S-box-containing protein
LTDNGSDRSRVMGLAHHPPRSVGTDSVAAAAQRADLLVDLFDHTSDLIQLIGIDGRIELVNPAWCQTLGYSQAEAIRLNVFNLIAPDCREHCQDLFAELLSQASRRRIECAFLARSGRRIELEGQLDVALEGGTPVRVRGILRDVTARRVAERAVQALNDSLESRVRDSTAALLSSEARLREAQALALVGHWDLDLRSGDIHWSDEICRIAGFDPARVTPSYATFLERVHPEDRPLVDAVHQRMAEFLQPFEFGYRLLLEGAEVRHIRARLVTHVAADGRPLRVIGTSQDVTPLVPVSYTHLTLPTKLL